MDNKTAKNKGERLTFFQLFNEKKWRIEIPIIQRDYAQGRSSASEVREVFLSTLHTHLLGEVNIDLDFVYGSLSESDDTLFVPLDGQQRLTTLFLLHWYLAIKEGKRQAFDDNLTQNAQNSNSITSNFTYETRTSSSDFCNALVGSNLDLTDLLPADKNKNNNLSKTIIDSPWYFSSWNNDPTIQSMLTMLDAIHQKFEGTSNCFEKLTRVNNPIITFQFLNLKEFRLTDDLYIKMNARGKQLTPFENFKAKFEQLIKVLSPEFDGKYILNYSSEAREVPIDKYFSHKIDTDWANLFWNYKDVKTHLFDNQLMNFIRVITTNHYALKEKSDEKLDNLKVLIGRENPDDKAQGSKPIGFFQYEELACFDKNLITELIETFDLLANGNSIIKKYLTSNSYFDENAIFKDVIENSLNYTERIRFFAFYKFLIFHKSEEGLLEWMRIIFNLTENTIYNRTDVYARSIKSIDTLIPQSLNFLQYVSNHKNTINSFLEIQVVEERIKAILLLKNDAWKEVILKIESHGYFKGQIGFILNFAGIEDYYDQHKNCNWNDEVDKNFFADFNN